MSDAALTRPTAKVEKDFLFSSGKLSLECNLEKDVFYHGQEIPVNLFINNNGNNQGIKLKGIYNKTVVVHGLLTNLCIPQILSKYSSHIFVFWFLVFWSL